ncbi:MAG TPA: type IV secretion system protein VirB4, partial [Acidocella sp.]|nr:type IV secretion system protein VirB4 [Acidocella sp.]
MLGDNGRSERGADKYLNYIGHISSEAVLMANGGLLAMAHVEGTAFELADHAARNARLRLLNTLFRNMADDNVVIYTHLIRHPDLSVEAPRHFRSKFAAALDAAYRTVILDNRLFRNDYYISLLVLPRSALGTGFAKRVNKLGKKFPTPSETLERELEDQWFVLENGLAGFNVRRLGLYE